VLTFGIWTGSIVFGWKQQPYWLAVPPVVCVGYTLFLLGRHRAWVTKGLFLGGRTTLELWMSGRAACLALFALPETSRRPGLGGHQDNVPRRDLALETICPQRPLIFADQEMVL